MRIQTVSNALKVLSVGSLWLSVSGCQSIDTMNQAVDSKLAGSWIGDYVAPDDARGWRQVRLADGTYYIDFIWANLTVSREVGKWWVDNGRFYEMSPDAERPDVYEYELISEQCVKFSLYDSPNESITSLPETYTFTDCKDGSAFPPMRDEFLYPAQSISKIIARSFPTACNYQQLKSSGLDLPSCSALLEKSSSQCTDLVTESEETVVNQLRVPLFLSRYVICTEAGLRQMEYSNSKYSVLFDQFIGE